MNNQIEWVNASQDVFNKWTFNAAIRKSDLKDRQKVVLYNSTELNMLLVVSCCILLTIADIIV